MSDGVSDAAFFRALVDAGGVGAGALALGSSPPAASRRLAAIEARLGVRLAERSARRFRLTEEGRLYYERGGEVLGALRDMEAEVSSRGSQARGILRIAAPNDLGRRHIAPRLPAFAGLHPGLSIQLALSDEGVEAGEDGFDIALRTGLPADPAIMVRKLAAGTMRLCAAPSYLAARGIPQSPDDLGGHRCLVLMRRHRRLDRWQYRMPSGETRDVLVGGSLASTSGDVLRQWALDGEGLSLEASWDVADDLAGGRLVLCLPEIVWQEVVLYATHVAGRPVPPRIRLALDWLGTLFGNGVG